MSFCTETNIERCVERYADIVFDSSSEGESSEESTNEDESMDDEIYDQSTVNKEIFGEFSDEEEELDGDLEDDSGKLDDMDPDDEEYVYESEEDCDPYTDEETEIDIEEVNDILSDAKEIYLKNSSFYDNQIKKILEKEDEKLEKEIFNEIKAQEKISGDTLYSDGAFNKFTNGEGWGSVVDSEGRDVIPLYPHLTEDLKTKNEILPRGIGKRKIIIAKFDDVASQQINGAEMLALLVALRIAYGNNNIKKIKCDSMVVISWATKGPLPDTLKKMDKKKKEYVEELQQLRRLFVNRGGEIEKISGDDNIADCGFHK